jgi:hypothetical protein
MGRHNQYECRWNFRHVRKGQILFEIVDKQNILVDEGEKAMVDSFFRKNDSNYFPSGDFFYVGFYKGTITEVSTLASIPNEPVGNGYARIAIERSSIGFPTLEQDEGHWRVVSKEVTFIASGGDIGPLNGAFLCTSSDNSGVLIGAVATGVERTIISGDQAILDVKFKQK